MTRLFFVALCLLSMNVWSHDDLTQTELENIVKSFAEEAEGKPGAISFVYDGMEMYLLSDVKHNRMRIMTPIIEYQHLTQANIQNVMNANFHSALDARYAVSNGVLYSVFIHPLSSLDKEQILSAVLQVFNLKVTFGSAYSSSVLGYGASSPDSKNDNAI